MATIRRASWVLCFLAIAITGELYLVWKDIYAPLPTLSGLDAVEVNGMRVEIAPDVSAPFEDSVEFYDPVGKRYQLSGVAKAASNQIRSALREKEPVVIRYGRWRSPFPSKQIFTVYQLEIGSRVVVPYEKLANARKREQAAGPVIIFVTIAIAGGALYVALRRERAFRRQLTSGVLQR